MKRLLFVTDRDNLEAAFRSGRCPPWAIDVVAKTGGALEEIRRRRPDVVAFDADAEHDIAWSLLVRLKSDPDVTLACTRAVMVGPPGEVVRLRAAIEGAVAYVTKPVEATAFHEALASALTDTEEPVLRRAAQQRALHELVRLERNELDDRRTTMSNAGTTAASPSPCSDRGFAPAFPGSDLDEAVRGLSEKQRAVLFALSETASKAAAARMLGVSESRVSAQVRAIAKRLGVAPDSVVDLARRTPAAAEPGRTAVGLGSELETAVGKGELTLEYQPIVSLATRRVMGAEALVRWNHPRHGVLRPASFLPVAEATGMVGLVTRWVLAEASSQLHRWRTELGLTDLDVTVNVSTGQAATSELVTMVEDLLAASPIEPASLILDIPAASLIAEPHRVATTVTRLKRLGVKVAIDDFAGSTLRSLKRFRVDVLKIDWSFVSGLGRSAIDTAIVEAALGLGAALEIDTHAKGVETQHQMETLAALGCRYAQGFHIAPSLTAARFSAFLA